MATNLLIGKELPNLKITLGVDKQEMLASSDEEGMIVEESEIKPDESKPNNTIVNSLIPEKTVRKYVNKQGGFDTGLDLTPEGQEKLQQRAERFGLEEPTALTQESFDGLYASLEVSRDTPGVRLDTIHLRGVEELSTQDIFQYFVLYGPTTLEWIDDYTCNVVWSDPAGAARALLGISKPLEDKTKVPATESQEPPTIEAQESVVLPTMEDDKPEEVILVSEDDDTEDESDAEESRRHKSVSCNAAVQTHQEDIADKEKPRPLLLTTRGQQWRLGEPHPKAPTMLMRFAFKDDIKLPGAEKRSVYYKKYGNPNYKGIKGVLTNTLRRRVRAQRKLKKVPSAGRSPTPPSLDHSESSGTSDKESDSSSSEGETDSTASEDESSPGGVKRKRRSPDIISREEIKRRKMQLYSDMEEKPRIRLPIRLPPQEPPRGSVYSRLGNRPAAAPKRGVDLRDRISGSCSIDLREKLNRLNRS